MWILQIWIAIEVDESIVSVCMYVCMYLCNAVILTYSFFSQPQ
jgi:hypothetical protein